MTTGGHTVRSAARTRPSTLDVGAAAVAACAAHTGAHTTATGGGLPVRGTALTRGDLRETAVPTSAAVNTGATVATLSDRGRPVIISHRAAIGDKGEAGTAMAAVPTVLARTTVTADGLR
ncbi:hypothetical protein, partial [Mycolicibacter kumamotonensis]|uniref:hypothetical protein n=1 Tax=Mycolicibacter kumamotonensis TaxID=354243 RepID=UPI001969A487